MDQEELGKLLINITKSIYGYLLKFGVNRTDADDIVQDTEEQAQFTAYQARF